MTSSGSGVQLGCNCLCGLAPQVPATLHSYRDVCQLLASHSTVFTEVKRLIVAYGVGSRFPKKGGALAQHGFVCDIIFCSWGAALEQMTGLSKEHRLLCCRVQLVEALLSVVGGASLLRQRLLHHLVSHARLGIRLASLSEYARYTYQSQRVLWPCNQHVRGYTPENSWGLKSVIANLKWGLYPGCNHETDALVHLFNKALPRRCQIRELMRFVGKQARVSQHVRCVVNRMAFFSFVGLYPHCASHQRFERIVVFASSLLYQHKLPLDRLFQTSMLYMIRECLISEVRLLPALRAVLCATTDWTAFEGHVCFVMDALRVHIASIGTDGCFVTECETCIKLLTSGNTLTRDKYRVKWELCKVTLLDLFKMFCNARQRFANEKPRQDVSMTDAAISCAIASNRLGVTGLIPRIARSTRDAAGVTQIRCILRMVHANNESSYVRKAVDFLIYNHTDAFYVAFIEMYLATQVVQTAVHFLPDNVACQQVSALQKAWRPVGGMQHSPLCDMFAFCGICMQPKSAVLESATGETPVTRNTTTAPCRGRGNTRNTLGNKRKKKWRSSLLSNHGSMLVAVDDDNRTLICNKAHEAEIVVCENLYGERGATTGPTSPQLPTFVGNTNIVDDISGIDGIDGINDITGIDGIDNVDTGIGNASHAAGAAKQQHHHHHHMGSQRRTATSIEGRHTNMHKIPTQLHTTPLAGRIIQLGSKLYTLCCECARFIVLRSHRLMCEHCAAKTDAARGATTIEKKACVVCKAQGCNETGLPVYTISSSGAALIHRVDLCKACCDETRALYATKAPQPSAQKKTNFFAARKHHNQNGDNTAPVPDCIVPQWGILWKETQLHAYHQYCKNKKDIRRIRGVLATQRRY